MKKKLLPVVDTIKKCSSLVLQELGSGWTEEVYQQAMEVALREHGIAYEAQRTLPITFNNHVIADCAPDLVVWTKIGNNKRAALVIDLKADTTIKGNHKAQVERYTKELKKQVKPHETVLPFGLVINFLKENEISFSKDSLEDLGNVQVLTFKT